MKVAHLVACAVLLGLGTPVAAQQQEALTGSRFTRDKFDARRAARDTLRHFGKCLASYKSDKIEAFLLNPSQENWEPVIYSPNNQSHCAVRNMSAGFREFRGAVAEGWYLKRFKDGPPDWLLADAGKLPSQDVIVAQLQGASDDAEKTRIMVRAFADCVAATAPAELDALFRTDVESDEEKEAFSAVGAYLGPCAFEGQNLSFDFESLRSMLAFALATRAARLTSKSS